MNCINALTRQIHYEQRVQIVVVDNYDNAENHAALQKLMPNRPYITLTLEKEAGLSRARNHAIALCSSYWIAFLDDDAKPSENFIEQAFWTIKNFDFDCFGGHIRSWWKHKRPRWLAPAFGEKPILSNKPIIITDDYNWGSNIFIKTSALKAIQGFPINIGMEGKKIGYSAENAVQKALRNDGCVIGYNPALIVDHLVIPQKLKLNWHIAAAYATGRDGRDIFPQNYTGRRMLSDLKKSIIAPFVSIFKLFFKRDYFWQNAYLDIFKTWALTLGRLISKK